MTQDRDELKTLAAEVAELKSRVEELQEEVRTGQIVIVDNNYQERAALGIDDDGIPSLRLDDDAGRTRVALRASHDGPQLELYGPNGEIRVSLRAYIDGTPRLELCDAAGNPIWKAP